MASEYEFLNSISLPDEAYDVIRKVADIKGMTVAQVVGEAIGDYLKKNEGMLEKKDVSRKPSLLVEG
jgi:hypothetical protein